MDEFARQPLLPNRLSQLGPGIAWGDVDGDGDDDVYVAGAKGHYGQLFLRDASGEFTRSQRGLPLINSSVEEMAPLFLDVEGDGDLDLYVVSGGVECNAGDTSLADRLYLNNGHGQFRQAPDGSLPDNYDSGSTVVSADFDRDGDLDLFVGSRSIPGRWPEIPESRLLQNDRGTFSDVTTQLAPDVKNCGLVTGALWSDVDRDGWLDLLVTNEWGPVKLFYNERGQLVDRTDHARLSSRKGWWNGITGRDLDNDGDTDYVVTNFGLNTKYHDPDETHPVKVFYGDFDGSGTKQIVEAKYGDDGLLPVRGKSCSQNAMPYLRQRFPTYHSFAIASLSEIYSPASLSSALELEATCLESGVLLNDGTGVFDFVSLPRLAQCSPAFGVAISDVNTDGNPDIYIVQNFYGPQPETGRMDGGVSLLMLGNGDANNLQFTCVWPNNSGLVLPHDATSVTTCDLNRDGRVDFVAAVNDQGVRSFENHFDGPGVPVSVRLSSQSPMAGAIVELHFDDGSVQSAEAYVGDGYLSQSGPTFFFAVPAETKLASVVVKWPDGETTVRHAPALTNSFLIQHPSDGTGP